MIWVPATVGVYVLVQLLLSALCATRVHGLGPKLPELPVEKFTVPVGAGAPEPVVSVTVAVHIEA